MRNINNDIVQVGVEKKVAGKPATFFLFWCHDYIKSNQCFSSRSGSMLHLSTCCWTTMPNQ